MYIVHTEFPKKLNWIVFQLTARDMSHHLEIKSFIQSNTGLITITCYFTNVFCNNVN